MSRVTLARLRSLTAREHLKLIYCGYYQAARRYGRKGIVGSWFQAAHLYARTWKQAARATRFDTPNASLTRNDGRR